MKSTWGVTKNKSLRAAKGAVGEDAPKVDVILQNIETLNQEQGLTDVQKPDDEVIEKLAAKLEAGYKKQHAKATKALSNQGKINSFTDYCLSLVKSNSVSSEEKKAILFLLKIRLSNTPLQNEQY